MAKRQGSFSWLKPRDPLAEGKPALILEPDAHRCADHPRSSEIDPEGERRVRRQRQGFGVLLCAIFCLGTVAAVVGEGGARDHLRHRDEHRALLEDVERRRAVTEKLRQQVEGLQQDPMERERVAREQLGFVRDGEVVFLLPKE